MPFQGQQIGFQRLDQCHHLDLGVGDGALFVVLKQRGFDHLLRRHALCSVASHRVHGRVQRVQLDLQRVPHEAGLRMGGHQRLDGAASAAFEVAQLVVQAQRQPRLRAQVHGLAQTVASAFLIGGDEGGSFFQSRLGLRHRHEDSHGLWVFAQAVDQHLRAAQGGLQAVGTVFGRRLGLLGQLGVLGKAGGVLQHLGRLAQHAFEQGLRVGGLAGVAQLGGGGVLGAQLGHQRLDGGLVWQLAQLGKPVARGLAGIQVGLVGNSGQAQRFQFRRQRLQALARAFVVLQHRLGLGLVQPGHQGLEAGLQRFGAGGDGGLHQQGRIVHGLQGLGVFGAVGLLAGADLALVDDLVDQVLRRKVGVVSGRLLHRHAQIVDPGAFVRAVDACGRQRGDGGVELVLHGVGIAPAAVGDRQQPGAQFQPFLGLGQRLGGLVGRAQVGGVFLQLFHTRQAAGDVGAAIVGVQLCHGLAQQPAFVGQLKDQRRTGTHLLHHGSGLRQQGLGGRIVQARGCGRQFGVVDQLLDLRQLVVEVIARIQPFVDQRLQQALHRRQLVAVGAARQHQLQCLLRGVAGGVQGDARLPEVLRLVGGQPFGLVAQGLGLLQLGRQVAFARAGFLGRFVALVECGQCRGQVGVQRIDCAAVLHLGQHALVLGLCAGVDQPRLGRAGQRQRELPVGCAAGGVGLGQHVARGLQGVGGRTGAGQQADGH